MPRVSNHMTSGPTGMASRSMGTMEEYWLHTPMLESVAAASGAAATTSRVASTTSRQTISASCSAMAPSWVMASARLVDAMSAAASSTNATLTLVVPMSMPSA